MIQLLTITLPPEAAARAVELAEAEVEFANEGGRGVGLADRIDRLRRDCYVDRVAAAISAIDEDDTSMAYVQSFTIAQEGEAVAWYRWHGDTATYIELTQGQTDDFEAGMVAGMEDAVANLRTTNADLLTDAIDEARAAGLLPEDA